MMKFLPWSVNFHHVHRNGGLKSSHESHSMEFSSNEHIHIAGCGLVGMAVVIGERDYISRCFRNDLLLCAHVTTLLLQHHPFDDNRAIDIILSFWSDYPIDVDLIQVILYHDLDVRLEHRCLAGFKKASYDSGNDSNEWNQIYCLHKLLQRL